MDEPICRQMSGPRFLLLTAGTSLPEALLRLGRQIDPKSSSCVSLQENEHGDSSGPVLPVLWDPRQRD